MTRYSASGVTSIRTRMISFRLACLLILAFFSWISCSTDNPDHLTNRGGGEIAKGWEYVYFGDYPGIGAPVAALQLIEPDRYDTAVLSGLKTRTGPSTNIFKDNYGVWVAGSNCLTCHASTLNDHWTPGLGRPFVDWNDFLGPHIDDRTFGNLDSASRRSALAFRRQLAALKMLEKGRNAGNPAFYVQELTAAHWNPDLTFREEGALVPDESWPVPVSDVPPLWNVKKKTRLYYNGQGTGDFRKLMMLGGLVFVTDTVRAGYIWNRFTDVAAWIQSLSPPEFPYAVDDELASAGKDLFERECRKCHGTYGLGGSYPNKIIPLNRIGTDSLYASYWKSRSRLPSWIAESWFGKTEPAVILQPQDGYVAPPLDGVWASAPYFHNGSVPSLLGVLDSRHRPSIWLIGTSYDSVNVGWIIEAADSIVPKNMYDTRHPGQSNRGHTFGDDLPDDERKAIIEYLKTL